MYHTRIRPRDEGRHMRLCAAASLDASHWPAQTVMAYPLDYPLCFRDFIRKVVQTLELSDAVSCCGSATYEQHPQSRQTQAHTRKLLAAKGLSAFTDHMTSTGPMLSKNSRLLRHIGGSDTKPKLSAYRVSGGCQCHKGSSCRGQAIDTRFRINEEDQYPPLKFYMTVNLFDYKQAGL